MLILQKFTNALAGFNMYKLIYKPTGIKPPRATLLDNIYTNIQITIDGSKSGIIISDINVIISSSMVFLTT